MESLFIYSAAIGGMLLVGQFLLGLIGAVEHVDFDGTDTADADFHGDVVEDADGDFDHVGHWFVGILSFRAIVASVTIFGLIGLAASSYFQPPNQALSFVAALAAAGATLYAVGWMIRSMRHLSADGTVRIEHAVGRPGSVYLSIPAHNAGIGKATVTFQDRTMELPATTAGDALPFGTPIVVVSVTTDGSVEVARQGTERPAAEGPLLKAEG